MDGYNAGVETMRDEEYPMLRGSVYLDHAGTTPYPKSLVDRFARAMTSSLFGNPHSASGSSQLSTSRIDDVRLRVLQFFGADPTDFDVVIVANATAGIKLVVEAMADYPQGFEYVYHQASHTSLVGARERARNGGRCVDDRQVQDWLDGRCCPFCEGIDGPGDDAGIALFAYPAQSNMDGQRFPLAWVDRARQQECASHTSRKTFVLLDAAALVSTSPLHLGSPDTAPDFTVLSFYKIFGFPDLGALIVRRQAQHVFDSRRYFGGGTVDMVVCAGEQWHIPKSRRLHERLEDGTLPVHSILALDIALDVHKELFGSMGDVAAHTSFLARRLHQGLEDLRHWNGEPVVYSYPAKQMMNLDRRHLGCGPVLAFNIRNSQGTQWAGLEEFEKLATVKQFHIRTGGVCNPGGMASALGLLPWEMKRNFSAGAQCGFGTDSIAGKPTGVIRISLGAMSTMSDVDSFVEFVAEFYADGLAPAAVQTEPAVAVPQPGPSRLHVHSLMVYPIKSCAGYRVPDNVDWEVRPEGLIWDREWFLVHRLTGQALSQNRYPGMVSIRPTLDFDRGELRVRFAGPLPAHLVTNEISVPLSDDPSVFGGFRAASSAYTPSRVCGEDISAQTYASAEINDFFSAVLGVPCLFARFPPGGQEGKSTRHCKVHLQKHQLARQLDDPTATGEPPARPAGGGDATTRRLSPTRRPSPLVPTPPDSDSELKADTPPRPRILLSNESPILTISLASLDALNEEIQARGGKAIGPGVFRANVVIADSLSSPSSSPSPLLLKTAAPSSSSPSWSSSPSPPSDRLACRDHGDQNRVPQRLAPYAEDGWASLRIGRHGFRMLGSCRRCHMICIDQETGEKGQEPFVTLSKTRRFDGKVFFGTHATYDGSKGDDVHASAPAGDANAGTGPARQPRRLPWEIQYPTIRVGDAVQPDL